MGARVGAMHRESGFPYSATAVLHRYCEVCGQAYPYTLSPLFSIHTPHNTSLPTRPMTQRVGARQRETEQHKRGAQERSTGPIRTPHNTSRLPALFTTPSVFSLYLSLSLSRSRSLSLLSALLTTSPHTSQHLTPTRPTL